MNTFLKESIILIFSCFGVSLGINSLMVYLGPKLGLMDQPDARRVHTTPIPRAGGIAIWLTFIASAYFGKTCFPHLFEGGIAKYLDAFTCASALLVAVGVIDDRQGIPPLVKLVGQIASALLFFVLKPGGQGNMFGYEIPYLLDAGIFVMWAVLLINAFNLIDGLDGLCGGLSCISLFVIALLALAESHFSNAMVIGLMVAAVAGFLRYNLNPAQIFLGDAGSMMLGLFLASAATQSGGRRAILGSILLPVAIAGVPLLDVLLAVWRRGARKLINRWSGGADVGIFSPDKDHLHHRFLARGINQRRVALLLQALAAVIAALAFLPLLMGSRGMAVTVSGFMLLGLFGLRHLAQVELLQTGSLVHMVIKRRDASSGLRKWYFLYDTLSLGIAAVVAMLIETNMGVRSYNMEWAIRFVTTFIASEMIVLHILRVYRRVWSRSTLIEFLQVSLALALGGFVSCSLFQAASGELAWSAARASMMAIAIATWLVLAPRALPDILRELALDSGHRSLTRRQNSGRQILVYGAGDMGNLFIKYLKFSPPADFLEFQISGFLDDSPTLKNRTINGFKVHGGLDMLKSITSQYPLHGILVAIHLLPEKRLHEIIEVAANMQLSVYLWQPDLSPRRVFNGFHPFLEEPSVKDDEAVPSVIVKAG